MNKLLKTSLLSVGLISIMGLTACQNSPAHHQAQQSASPPKGDRHFFDAKREHFNAYDRRFDKREYRENRHRTPLTAEQRAELDKNRLERQAQHAARQQAIQNACAGKIGQNISIKIDDKTIEGSCQVHFRPSKPQQATPPQNTAPVAQTAS